MPWIGLMRALANNRHIRFSYLKSKFTSRSSERTTLANSQLPRKSLVLAKTQVTALIISDE
jgi:hypothetical protein